MLAWRRFVACAYCDAEIQLRNGLYSATAFVVAISAAILLALPAGHFAALLPAIALNNLAITSFFFMAALVLLEQSEGSPLARAVAPLRAGEYLAAKLVTLAALGVLQHFVLGVLLGVALTQLPLLLLGVALAAVMLALAGFMLAVRYRSINEMLLPAVPWIALLQAPIMGDILGWNSWFVYLHPMQAPIVLMHAAIQGGPCGHGWQFWYGLGYSLLWIAAMGVFARRSYQHWEVAT